jgi:hypothetical protein
MTSIDLHAPSLTLGPAARRLWVLLTVAGLVSLGVAVGLAQVTDDGAARFFRAYLVNFTFFLSLALGAVFFILVTHLTRAGWSIALRRIAEAFAFNVFTLFPLALVILFGIHELYEWSHHDVVQNDPLLLGKAGYLNTTFFVIRVLIYFAIWGATAWYFIQRSLEQDQNRDPRLTQGMERRAAPAVAIFALSLTFAAFDFLMSLYPHWYSTIWGVYYFAGAVVGFVSLLALMLWALQRAGRLTHEVTFEHYHDVGKLMFAFVVFWAYIAFSQFMLIWYANIPEETTWYLERQTGDWAGVSLLLLFGHFILPFLFLVSRHPKRRTGVLAGAAVWLLLMHWLDLYWIVMPQISPGKLAFFTPDIRGLLLDITCFVGIGGVFFGVALFRLARHRLIPVGDPRLEESLMFENA